MKNKTMLGILIAAVLLAVAAYFVIPRFSVPSMPAAFDARNSSFEIDKVPIVLANGISAVPAAPGSASMITTRYFGNQAIGDLNHDGYPDAAFLVTQDGGGSGLFYYAVAALGSADGYRTANAFLIGDRIAPQSTEINPGAQELLVNYAKRKPGEPMSAQPSVGATLVLKVNSDGVLEAVVK